MLSTTLPTPDPFDFNLTVGHQTYFRGRAPYRAWTHLGCWFQEKSPAAYAADGDSIIRVSCNLAFVSRFGGLAAAAAEARLCRLAPAAG